MIRLNGNIFSDINIPSFAQEMGLVGYYRANRKSITLMDMTGEKIGVINQHGVLCSASKLDNGKWWYSYMNPLFKLGIMDEYPYSQQCKDIENAMRMMKQ